MSNDPSLPPNHPINSADPSIFTRNSSVFAPKLTFEDRCSILALSFAGVSARRISIAFGIDRRTVSNLRGANSNTHYKRVRAEAERLGPNEFKRKYLTERVIQMVSGVAVSATRSASPKPRARGSAGLHVISTPNTKHSHRIYIGYKEAGSAFVGSPAGWFYRDLDSDRPDDWFRTNDDKGLLTSGDCLKCVISELYDVEQAS